MTYVKEMSMQRIRACLYADPGNTGMSRAVDCSCVHMGTGTSRLTGIPVEATEIAVKRDKLCPYKRNIPVHRDEVK